MVNKEVEIKQITLVLAGHMHICISECVMFNVLNVFLSAIFLYKVHARCVVRDQIKVLWVSKDMRESRWKK